MNLDSVLGKKSSGRKRDRKPVDLRKAQEIARVWDERADHYVEYENGFHFISNKEIFSLSGTGFAVSKKDGGIFPGYAAKVFLRRGSCPRGTFEPHI